MIQLYLHVASIIVLNYASVTNVWIASTSGWPTKRDVQRKFRTLLDFLKIRVTSRPLM